MCIRDREGYALKNFDSEYSTQYVKEMKYLMEHGVRYSFVKSLNGLTTYKYKKTSELFKLLEIFYSKFEK